MQKLKKLLESIDHKGYPAYKAAKGKYQFGEYLLCIDHVQGDPFASPSRVSIRVKKGVHQIPDEYYENRARRIALEDRILRIFGKNVEKYAFKAKGSGKSGLLAISRPGQEILERSACHVDAKTGELILRLSIGFPANGRTINAGELIRILYQFLPEVVKQSCLYPNLDSKQLIEDRNLADDRECIVQKMREEGYVAFIADGSILPRESGVSERPMKEAVPFASPESMRVNWELPHKGMCQGMGIKTGVSLIVGGGYHGKSTLLQTLEKAVYPHIPGDGREYVVTDMSACKIRSEDGRSIAHVDISDFIRNLPNGKDTQDFSTLDASGSTSQAANVAEAVEAGTKLLLIDEDTSATNFMIRDALMEKVVLSGKEPIIPFIRQVRNLYESQGVSTILVVGSCGAFFEVADKVVQMDCYLPYDVTKQAKEAVQSQGNGNSMTSIVAPMRFGTKKRMLPVPKQVQTKGRYDRTKIKVMGTDGFVFNKRTVDLRYLEQITDSEQMLALGKILDYVLRNYAGKTICVAEVVGELEKMLEREGLYSIVSGDSIPDMAMPRRFEIAGCINRFL